MLISTKRDQKRAVIITCQGLGAQDVGAGMSEFHLAIFDHEASKQDTPVGATLSHQGISSALHYLLHHLLLNLGGDRWGRGVSPHAPSVGPCVPLSDCLVILHAIARQWSSSLGKAFKAEAVQRQSVEWPEGALLMHAMMTALLLPYQICMLSHMCDLCAANQEHAEQIKT